MIDAGLKSREQYLIEQNIDPEAHAKQLENEGWVNPRVAAAPQGAQAPNGQNTQATAAEDNADLESDPAPTGEFANMSRLQLTRNSRAIDDTLNKIEEGVWTTRRARVFLESLGLKSRTIDNLLAEYEEQPA